MTETVNLKREAALELCIRALVASNTSPDNALSTARALVAAEADGQSGHGLSRVPSYALQARTGKVDGRATPTIERVAAALVRIDARSGFAYPAIDLATDALPSIAPETGVAAAAIHRSHHLGQAGAHAERLARRGLVALVFSNSPKAINFWGGREPMLGTNPVAFAAPRRDNEPLVIDLALSKVARGRIMAADRRGEKIPPDWALDAHGMPTDDPAEALKGSLLPIGDAKGAALVLIVELLAAALTGSDFGFEASSFFDDSGGPPHIGHTLVVFDPDRTSAGRFGGRLETVIGAIEATPGARLPGLMRLERRREADANGLDITVTLYRDILAIADREDRANA